MGGSLRNGQERTGSGMKQLLAATAAVMVMMLLGGCAKFTSSRKMDAGPFSENVSAMMADVTAEVRKPFYIKPYVNVPSAAEYRAE